ncbi:MAG: right-handed parallel beta-helix repeat-containing protein [Anaerolineae bacterium]|nr:right-handed parallel beta-helix repeat-containing protein [Anaerolineae bacterium]
MKIQRFRVVAALMSSLGLLVLVVVALSIASAPSILHASPLAQVDNPCGYVFHIVPDVFPPELCGTRFFTVPEELQPALGDLYVAPDGTDVGTCTDSDFPCRTVQYAVDQASEGSVIKVASGIYTDLNARARNDLTNTGIVTQVAYISKSVTLRGGYVPTNWYVSNPISYPTTLDAQGQGRVFYITGADALGAGISPTLEGLTITGGDSAGLGGGPSGETGGGVYAISASVMLSGCQVVFNTANQFIPYGGDGGGIYLIYSPNAMLIANTIRDNEAWFGGGVYIYASDNATLISNTVLDNLAHGWYGAGGGGILLRESANVMLSGNTIQGNATQIGGGVLLLGSDNATLKGNTILSNTAFGSHIFLEGGGGVSVRGSDGVALIRNIIRGNESTWGGGICLVDSRHGMLDNNVIADNQWGGGVLVADSTVHLRHTTLARNRGENGFYGFYITGLSGYSTVALTNTILVSHTAGISITAGSTATLEATLWGAGVWANTADYGGSGTIITGTSALNIWGDPAFMNPDAGDYHINAASAAVNAGVDTGVLEDIDGEPRTDGHPDIGVDEVQSVLSVTKWAYPSTVEAGERLTYTIRITNTGNTDLHAVITDTLPLSVTLGGTPGGTIMLPDGRMGITWTASIPAPGSVWMETLVVTVAMGYSGPLTNVVNVATEEGATGIDTETVDVITRCSVYLPLVLRN